MTAMADGSLAPPPPSSITYPRTGQRVLVVGAGAIGGVVSTGLLGSGRALTVLTTNERIHAALEANGFRLAGTAAAPERTLADVRAVLDDDTAPFDFVLLATQPPQVEEAIRDVARFVAPDGRVVCFQNGLCEQRVAKVVGRERVIGAVIAWGASMLEPGVYERTSSGGFTMGRLDGTEDERLRECATLLGAVGPVALTQNLLGARWSKLAINCAVSTLGTIGGDRVGPLMRRGFVRRLALEIMTETVLVARRENVRLEKVAGTVDLDWLALADERRTQASPGLVARHAVLSAAGFRYRRLRSSMLQAIERGRPPAVDFLNGEVVEHGASHGVPTPVNAAAKETVWRIARGEAKSSVETLARLYEETRGPAHRE
jgi:2-dehydropantoate 2-reductase